MGLTKNQAVALYVLLTTDSNLVDELGSQAYADSTAFANRLIALTNAINGPAMDFSQETKLQNLYDGDDGNGGTLIERNPVSIRANIVALEAPYGGGPCPGSFEQSAIWHAVVGATLP